MSAPTRSRTYAIWLFVLMVLFCFRVAGQMLVAFAGVTFLPPMEEWYSGLLPYRYLLPAQFLIILLFAKICLDLFRGRGFFALTRNRLGALLKAFGIIYLAVMVIRYVLRMSLYPPERWTGGSIPIFFHWVLAAYVLVFASFNRPGSEIAQIRDSRRTLWQRVGYGLFAFSVLAGMLLWITYQLAPTLLAKKLRIRRAEYAVRSEPGIAMTASDGVKLVSDIYHPYRLRTAPTILVRIPYSKTFTNQLRSDIVGRLWAERGYTVIIQSTRGRNPSGGDYYPLRSERQDGIETLAWISKQPWFDGRIGMWGGSTFGYTQWALADAGPSSLMIYLSSTNFYRMFYPGGAFALESALNWAVRSRGPQDEPDWPSTRSLQIAYNGWPELEADTRAAGSKIDFFRDWISHRDDDSYWQQIDGDNRAAHIKAPVLLMAGWYDPFLPGQLSDFETIRRYAAPEVASRTRLVIGPWAHAMTVGLPKAPDLGNFRLATLAPSVSWFDETLAEGKSDEFPVRIFVMGINQWRDEQEWPLARAQNRNLYLSSDGTANTLKGNGGLLANPPSSRSPADHFTYDPRNAIPTAGGAMIGNEAGVFLQNQIESRSDVLVYTTPAFDQETEITGPPKLVLYVSTTARNTDFTGKLVDVFPDGSAYNISDGILRRSYDRETQLRDTGSNEIAIDLWPTSYVIATGHKLRLEVSSSDYPHYDRNPNTGGTIATETLPVAARQTVYHDKERPSHLVLPFVSR